MEEGGRVGVGRSGNVDLRVLPRALALALALYQFS